MKSNVMNVVKGAAIGMVSGVVVGFVGKKMIDDGKRGLKRAFKKKTDRAMSTIENIADTVKYMFE